MRTHLALLLVVIIAAAGGTLPEPFHNPVASPGASAGPARTPTRGFTLRSQRVDVRAAAVAPVRAAAGHGMPNLSLPATSVRPATKASKLILGPADEAGSVTAQVQMNPMVPFISAGFSGMDDTVDDFTPGCSGAPRPCIEPPDPWVAAGPNHIVQAVNIALRITARADGSSTTVALASFFAAPGGQLGDGDPRVLYDAAKERWLATEFSYDCTAGHQYLGVSDTADPTGTWTVWNISYPLSVPDYPGLGMSSDKVLLSADNFEIVPDSSPAGCSLGGFLGGSLVVVDWADVLDGGTLANVAFGPDANLGTWRPASTQGAGSTAHAIVEDLEFGFSDLGFATIVGTVAGADVTMPIFRNLTHEGLADEFKQPPAPRQPGSPSTIVEAVDGRPTDAVWGADRLWLAATSPCLIDIVRACARLVEIDTSDPSATNPVLQDVRLGWAGFDSYMPGIGLSGDGTAWAVYTRSSTYSPAGIEAVYNAVGDPEYRGWHEIKPGAGTYNGSRWGDYVGVSPDPNAPGAVWQGQQYANASGGWSTWVSRLSTGSVGTPGLVTRLFGANRYGTAAAISAATFSPGVPVAFIATGANYPDALAGGAAAAYLDSPLLLVTKDTIPDATKAELARLAPGRIVVLGGSGTVGDSVVTALAGYTPGTVTRLAGPDRYATAAAISAATFSVGVPFAFVAVGTNYPDALAGGPAAGLVDSPLLLVTKTTIPSATATELTRLKPALILVLGGTGAISESVKTALAAYAKVAPSGVLRISGADRYATAAQVAELFTADVSTVYIATGANYPDALAGGAAASYEDAPLLLVTYATIPTSTASELARLSPARIVVLGGTGVISDAVMDALAAYISP